MVNRKRAWIFLSLSDQSRLLQCSHIAFLIFSQWMGARAYAPTGKFRGGMNFYFFPDQLHLFQNYKRVCYFRGNKIFFGRRLTDALEFKTQYLITALSFCIQSDLLITFFSESNWWTMSWNNDCRTTWRWPMNRDDNAGCSMKPRDSHSWWTKF